MEKRLVRPIIERFRGWFAPRDESAENDKWWGGRRAWALLGAVMVLAAGLRLINISQEVYWGDEILSLDIVEHFQRPGDMVRYVSEVEFHPPLYYLMLQPWVRAFGAGEASTRSLSLIFSLANVALVYFFALSLFRRRSVALASAFVMAVLPIQVEFGQEARPYAMVCFAATLAALALWEHLKDNSWKWAALYVAATVFGLYLHYSYILAAIVMTGWWMGDLASRQRFSLVRGRSFLLSNAAVFLLFFPWLDSLLYKMMLSDFMIYGMPRFVEQYRGVGLLGEIFDILLWVSQSDWVPGTLTTVYSAACLAMVGAAAVFVYRLGKSGDGGRLIRPLWYLSYLAGALLILFIASPLSVPYAPLYVRHALFFTVPFAVLLAQVLVGLGRQGWFVAAFLLAVAVPPLVTVVGDDGLWEYQHRLAVVGKHVAEQARPGDLVIVSRTAARSDFAHYIPENIPVVAMLPLNYFGNDVWSSRRTLGLVENESQVRGYRLHEQTTVASDGTMVTEDAVWRKLDRLNDEYRPERMWLYSFNNADTEVHSWFKERGWRRATASLGYMFSLDLYVHEAGSAEE